MEKSFGIFFHLKKAKKISSGELPIYLRITINGSVTELSTKRRYHPSKWNKTAGRAESKTEEAKSLNAFLDVIQQKVHETRRKLMEDDRPITEENIKIVPFTSPRLQNSDMSIQGFNEDCQLFIY